jgi:hypothetical protein
MRRYEKFKLGNFIGDLQAESSIIKKARVWANNAWWVDRPILQKLSMKAILNLKFHASTGYKNAACIAQQMLAEDMELTWYNDWGKNGRRK